MSVGCDKRMRYIKSVDGMDYYVFSPSLFRQYFNKTEDWTPHRARITRKLHMLFYYVRGGYKILYMMDGENIAAYIIFVRGGNTVVDGSSKNDIFTVFVTTHPEYRKKGLATKIVYEMLHGIGLRYESAYKTIADSNIGSQKAAFSNGYSELYYVAKSGVLKTVTQATNTGVKLYKFKES